MSKLDLWCRRIVAYLLVGTGYLLTTFAGWMIKAGAWLLGHEDLIKKG